MIEIRIPSVGESIDKFFIGEWFVQNGEQVNKDSVICEAESDKATLEIIAPETGTIYIKHEAGTIATNETVIAILKN